MTDEATPEPTAVTRKSEGVWLPMRRERGRAATRPAVPGDTDGDLHLVTRSRAANVVRHARSPGPVGPSGLPVVGRLVVRDRDDFCQARRPYPHVNCRVVGGAGVAHGSVAGQRPGPGRARGGRRDANERHGEGCGWHDGKAVVAHARSVAAKLPKGQAQIQPRRVAETVVRGTAWPACRSGHVAPDPGVPTPYPLCRWLAGGSSRRRRTSP